MIEESLALIQFTNEVEIRETQGTSYLDCFRKSNLRRTEIACVVWIAQVFCGIWFGGNVTYFLSIADGLSTKQAFNIGLGNNGLALIATISAWALCQRAGRRTLYLVGLATQFTLLLTIGFLGIPKPGPALAYASAACMYLFVMSYDLTVGPICYCLVAEVPSTRLRIKTAVLARTSYIIASIVANFLNPPILNPLGWDLRGKGGFIWGGLNFLVLVWTFFRLPETKGRTSGELDLLFEDKVPTRAFKKTDISMFDDQPPATSQRLNIKVDRAEKL